MIRYFRALAVFVTTFVSRLRLSFALTETPAPSIMNGQMALRLHGLFPDGYYLVLSRPWTSPPTGNYTFHKVFKSLAPSLSFEWQAQFEDTGLPATREMLTADHRALGHLYLGITASTSGVDAVPDALRVYRYETLVGVVQPPLQASDGICAADATGSDTFAVLTRQGRRYSYGCTMGQAGSIALTLTGESDSLHRLQVTPIDHANLFNAEDMLVEVANGFEHRLYWHWSGNAYGQFSAITAVPLLGRRWWWRSWSEGRLVVSGDGHFFRVYYQAPTGSEWLPIQHVTPDGVRKDWYVFPYETEWDVETFGQYDGGPLWLVTSSYGAGMVQVLRLQPDVDARTFTISVISSRPSVVGTSVVAGTAWYHALDGVPRYVELTHGGILRLITLSTS